MYRRLSHKGFTLVETLVAITILLVVIVGPMTIASRGLQTAHFANEQTTAIFLAQEAVEHFERLRDNNALDVVNGSETDTWQWYTDLVNTTACELSTGCDYDIVGDTYRNCNAESCQLQRNSTVDEYMYGYDGSWSETSPFTRTVTVVETPPASGQVLVTVEVSWDTVLFATTRDVTIQSWLFDHYSWLEP